MKEEVQIVMVGANDSSCPSSRGHCRNVRIVIRGSLQNGTGTLPSSAKSTRHFSFAHLVSYSSAPGMSSGCAPSYRPPRLARNERRPASSLPRTRQLSASIVTRGELPIFRRNAPPVFIPTTRRVARKPPATGIGVMTAQSTAM